MKSRIGKFKVSQNIIENEDAPRIFAAFGFVPMRVEHHYHNGTFEMIGLSHLFDEVDEGYVAPEYDVTITVHEDLSISVEATRL